MASVSIRPTESVFVDFTISEGTIAATMSAAWIIRDVDNVEVASGTLDKDVGETIFELRIENTDTDLDDGSYDLLVYVSDSSTGFGNYIYDTTLKVKDA